MGTAKKISLKEQWKNKFRDRMAPFHTRKLDVMVARMLRKLDSVKSSMVSRSKKYDVPCEITLEEIRQLAYDAYGTTCKYSGRPLTLKTMVFDHIIPISKGGPSTKDNVQVISKFANAMKGSLREEHFYLLLEWLESVPEELAKDVSIRLAHGVR